ncbi:unnamed protein product [Rotaria sp. Silwood2]|nr:unnamed protein product [Rotaria sp. Silwood2]CAF4058965.1 unnamed protein product [Rotaria sp. Silwood2]
MSIVQQQQQHNNNNNLFQQLIRLLDVDSNGRLVLPFSRRLILIDRPLENSNKNDHNVKNDTSVNSCNNESEFSLSLSENDFLNDNENNDDNSPDATSFDSISLPPSPFICDPYESYDWEC